MTPPFGSPFSQEAMNLLALEAGLMSGQAFGATEFDASCRDGADDDHDWESAWIDLGGEG